MRHIVLTAPDLIKLDRSLIDGVGRDGVLHTLVRSLVDFAHDSGSAVVAEGIEQPVDAAVLAALGVDYGQGYFYGRPGPPGALATAAEDRCRPADRRAETITTG
jgi:EAL domain-containing protein (putative c-di-GMP-specific phosphodiesterase class I)